VKASTSWSRVILSLLMVPISFSLRAQQPPGGVDGCTILASVVYSEVSRARLGYFAGAFGEMFYPGRDETSLCSHTARSATRAFTSALRDANIFLTWGAHTGYIRNYCSSHVLAQCYPMGDPAMPPLSPPERMFMMRSWRAVYDSVTAVMSLYPGSDVSRFRGRELGRSIRRSITSGDVAPAVSGGWHLPRDD
jgi:hypothetical protein